jgi:hypothetical protein
VAPALALAPVAVPADAVKATTANASTASSASFVLPLSRILSPMELIEGGFMPQSPPGSNANMCASTQQSQCRKLF